MKLNKFSMMLAAAALVGCSDDFGERFAGQSIDDSRLIQLNPNFVLAGVGNEDAATRTHWDNLPGGGIGNLFLPTYAKAFASGDRLSDMVDNSTYEKVGLCWLGQTPNENVYTNYEFYHYGWLVNGASDTEIECNEVTNGCLYNEIPMQSGSINAEADPATDFKVTSFPAKALSGSQDNLNYNSGIYKTDNKSIFGGDYIVYYPFNEDFKDAGTIPAIAETKFEGYTDWKDPEIGKATFRYSAPTTIEGGAKAAGFKMNNLSTVAQLRIASVDGAASCAGQTIDQIVLYSPSEKLLKQANLRADMIAAGKKGTELYASTVGTKTIVANFSSAYAIESTNKAGGPSSAYITLLPTTVDDLEVLVHSGSLQKWARGTFNKNVFEAGKADTYKLDLNIDDFKEDYIAVDEASLTNALTEARNVATASNRKTITVIGDIVLGTTPYYINKVKDEFITIKGDDIIVPEDKSLYLNTNMESDVRVLGKTCCSGSTVVGGSLYVHGGTLHNVTMEPTQAKVTETTYDDYNPWVEYAVGDATIAAGAKIDVQAGNVEVSKAVAHMGDFDVAAGAKVLVKGTGALKFLGSTVNNYGTIEVLKEGQFDMKSNTGTTTAAAGRNMTNHPGAKFIHNVDAAVGTAVQNMNQNGEYRCRVDQQSKLNDAYIKWTACNVIEMVNRATPQDENYDLVNVCKHTFNGGQVDVDIEVNNTGKKVTFINTTATNGDSRTITIGNLTVKSELDVTYVQGTGKRTLVVNGDVLVDGTNGKMIYSNGNKIAVTGDITVDNAAAFVTAPKALNVTCANFYLKNGATATFGNRLEGTTMTVYGTISNPYGCTFDITAANTNPANGLLAYITCTALADGGSFPGGEPLVIE